MAGLENGSSHHGPVAPIEVAQMPMHATARAFHAGDTDIAGPNEDGQLFLENLLVRIKSLTADV